MKLIHGCKNVGQNTNLETGKTICKEEAENNLIYNIFLK